MIQLVAWKCEKYGQLLSKEHWHQHNAMGRTFWRDRARRGGAEVAGWTLDRKIRVRFPAYPHRVWALWWQGGKRRLRTSRCPCRGRLGTLKTPSCPWRGCPAAGQNLETGHLSRHYIAEISLNVTLNHNQQQQQLKRSGLPSNHDKCKLDVRPTTWRIRIHYQQGIDKECI